MRKILTVLVCTILTGCCSIINGRKQEVPMVSYPSGAKATAETGASCTTPCSLELRRNKRHFISIEKEGYETAGKNLTRRPSAWLLGNVLLGGVIGLGVDFATGGIYCLRPDEVEVKLEPKKQLPEEPVK